jgi:hypothetical protein
MIGAFRRRMRDISWLYSGWRSLRERQQLRAFDQLLDVRLGTAASAAYSAQLTAKRLAATAKGRNSWLPGEKPVIAIFGTMEWEAHGLWDALRALADVSLWQYRPPFTATPPQDHDTRLRLARGFLEHVDAMLRDGPVHVAFFYASAEFVAPSLIEELHRRGVRTVVMGLDDKHQFLDPTDPDTGEPLQLQLARCCDLYWTTWRTGAELIVAEGGNPWYAPEAADPDRHRPLGLDRDIDVLFLGSAYGARGDLVRYLRQRGFGVETYGTGWPNGFVAFDESVALYSRAHVVLGIGGVGHMGGVKHLKGRDFEAPMCGTVYLTSFNPELADHFVIGSEVLCYGSFQDCADTLHRILRQPEEAAEIRAAARAAAVARHSWVLRLQTLLGLFHSGTAVDARTEARSMDRSGVTE